MVDRSLPNNACWSIALINPMHVQWQDKKQWKREKELACQFGWITFTCPCHKCKGNRCQVSEMTMEKHLVDYGRHLLFRVWKGDRDRNKSDDNWEANAR